MKNGAHASGWLPISKPVFLLQLCFPTPVSKLAIRSCIDAIRDLPLEDQRGLAADILGSLGKFDIPLRELEHSAFTFEVILDQGAYFELKRHRMMTQSVQTISPDLGYAIPSAITRAGLEDHFKQAMQMAAQTYHHLSCNFSPCGCLHHTECLQSSGIIVHEPAFS